MRILALTNWYPPHHRGGYEVHCADIMKRLARRGHDVQVLCGDERLDGVEDVVDTIPARRDLQLYWRDEWPWQPGLRQQVAVERHNQAALERALDEFAPDLVSVWHMAVISLNLLTTLHRRGIPIVYTMGDVWPTYTLKQDPWAARFDGPVRRALARPAELLFGTPAALPHLGRIGPACFISTFLLDEVREHSRWPFQRTLVIPAGIDPEILGDAKTDNRRDWSWRLMYVGRFDERKGIYTLVRALTLLPEATLAVYGRGVGERARLEELAEDLGVIDRLSFVSVERHELGDAYRASDCVIFPSEWPEPFGMVPLEAMQCGTPVVASGVGGSKEFLSDEVNCLLFTPGDPQSLADAIRRIASNRELRHRVREGGFETAAEYDVEVLAERYEELYRSEIASASVPGLPGC